MVIFLLDEATVVSQGANCVMSLLDYFFDNYGVKEARLHLHADNCTGQNKNNAMVQYLLWRVITGKHQSITLSFMLAGLLLIQCLACSNANIGIQRLTAWLILRMLCARHLLVEC